MHPGRGAAGSTGGLSAEQQQRMEENRRKAQAKLAAKRTVSTTIQAPPPAKRPAYASSAASTPKSSCYDNARSHPNSAEARSSHFSTIRQPDHSVSRLSRATSTQGPYQASSSSTTTFNTDITLHSDCPSSRPVLQKPPFYSKPSTSHLPASASSTQYKATPNIATTTTTNTTVTKLSSFYSKPSGSPSQSTATSNSFAKSVSASKFQKPSLATNHPPSVKYTQLQEKKKARVYMISRTRCEVSVQYDHELIETFKKMPSRAYSE